MGIASSLKSEVMQWGSLALVLVVIVILLEKFGTMTVCTGNCSEIIGLFVVALKEPANWVEIAILAVVGFAVYKLFTRKKGKF